VSPPIAATPSTTLRPTGMRLPRSTTKPVLLGSCSTARATSGVRMRQWRSLLGNDLLQGFRFLGRTQLVPVADHNVG